MKVIELLNRIANKEELPNKIRFNNIEWNRVYGEKNVCYIDEYDSDFFLYFFRNNLDFTLNDEVEIIEEKKEETKSITKESIEALGYACGEIQKCFTNGWEKSLKNKPLNEEDKKIRKIKVNYSPDLEEKIFYEDGSKPRYYVLGDAGTELLINKINEIIDYINGGTNGE